MNTESTAGAEQWFSKGSEAMIARQWDYAIECLTNAIRLSPDTLAYRRAKYKSCRRKHRDEDANRTSVKLVDIRRKLLQARLTKNWIGVDKWAEEGISQQPWDAQFFAHVAAACTEMSRREVAHYAWVMALKLERSNVSYNRDFGRFLCAERDYDGAEKCYRRILEQAPEDRQAQEMLRYIDVERLMNRDGYASAGSTRDVEVAANATEEGGLAFNDNRGGTPPANTTSPAATESPARQKAHQLRLARQCAEQRRWDMCIDAYRKALEFDPLDADTREQLENAELSKMREVLEQLQRAAGRNPGSQQLQLEAMEQERRLIDRRIAINTERCERYRSDMNLRFDLAEDLSRIGEYRKAIPLYQQACQNHNRREQALLKLGQCWICDGKRDLASRQFVMALKTINPAENPDAWKTAHYWLGRISESEGQPDTAKGHYSEVLLLDYDFRDTVQRLEVLQNDSAETVRPDA